MGVGKYPHHAAQERNGVQIFQVVPRLKTVVVRAEFGQAVQKEVNSSGAVNRRERETHWWLPSVGCLPSLPICCFAESVCCRPKIFENMSPQTFDWMGRLILKSVEMESPPSGMPLNCGYAWQRWSR
jgi:hypothetical protein